MRLKVNGTEREAVDGTSVLGLVQELGLSGGRVAVELNGTIIPKNDFGTTVLADGDVLEILGFVGGG